MKKLTERQAIAKAKKQFCNDHNLTRLPKNCAISIHSRYFLGGKYVLISNRKGLTTEFYFNQ